MIRPFIIILILFSQVSVAQVSRSYDFQKSPTDYLLGDRGRSSDAVFDEYRTIELGLNLSSGVDCGRLDLQGTLKASVDKILDPKMFGNALENIKGGAPLLTICYFSPTWCSIAKHFRVNAQSMSQIRLDQCSLMDKYVDSRVEDYYQERQSCLHKELQRSGGNHEEAVSKCGGSGVFQRDLANWAGEKFGGKVKTNKLIESSAKWAGLTGPKAKRAVELVKAFVGDTTVTQGNVSVEYGPRKMALAPSQYLAEIKRQTYKDLCGGVLKKLEVNSSSPGVLTDKELEVINTDGDKYLDHQTVYYLSIMPPIKKNAHCERLAASIAMSKFSKDINRSVQVLTELGNNPNLPPQRKKELEDKARRFKNSVEISIELEKQRNEPINKVLAQINLEGQGLESSITSRSLKNETTTSRAKNLRTSFFDCADGVYCDTKGAN